MSHLFKTRFVVWGMLLGCLLIVTGGSTAQFVPYSFDITMPEGVRGGILDGNTLLANHLNLATSISHAEAYVRSGASWILQATFVSDKEGADGSTYIKALDGDTAVVTDIGRCDTDGGAPQWDPVIFVYHRTGTTWTQQARFEIGHEIRCGIDVALDGNTLIITQGGELPSYVGTAYFYEFNGTAWIETDSIELDVFPGIDVEEGSKGNQVALSGDTALATGDQDADGEDEIVHVFKRSGGSWSEQTTLPNNGGLLISGNTVLMIDKIYVTDGTNWTLQATLPAHPPFGFSGAALEGDTILATSTDRYGYVFTRSGSTWTQQQILNKPGGTIFSGTGPWGISGNYIVIDTYIFKQDASQEVLVNGSFETDTNGDFVPDGWKRKNSTGDGQRCNKPGLIIPVTDGNCAYLFKDDASGANKLVQNIDLNAHDFNTGDKV
ncbi:MAG TPA: hypothetical protein VHL11_18535, partial [Phototrophicaceae bacterium]|nr:hypothetical protein [Phototrophicaceae bacterium]